MKTTVILMLAGALLGVVIASFIVPPALAWYSSPGGLPQGAQIQAIVQISEVIRYSTSKLLQGQLIGGGIGAVAGLVAGVFANIRSRRDVAPSPLPPVNRTTPA
jgi:hypothetical protein